MIYSETIKRTGFEIQTAKGAFSGLMHSLWEQVDA